MRTAARGTGPPAWVLLALLVLPLQPGCAGADGERHRLRLATTTSTYNSGLLDVLLPPFERRTGIEVQVLSVGTGQALALGARGEVDLVLVHARAREDAFVAQGLGVDRRDVMWNDFVLLGPPADPAGVRGGRDAAAALARIRERQALFVSRGDDSGTHIREKELWAAAGVAEPAWPGYLETGQGMGNTLTIADEKLGYVLADRGTYLAFAGHMDLRVMVEGDPALRNPYGVIMVNPERHPRVAAREARRLMDHLTSPEGQELIAGFTVHGDQLFHPAAAGR